MEELISLQSCCSRVISQMQAKKGGALKFKIDSYFLIDWLDHDKKTTRSHRINNELYVFIKSYCDENNMKVSDYMNKLVLIHAMYENDNMDLFSTLEELKNVRRS